MELLASEIFNHVTHEALLGIPNQNKSLLTDQKELLSWHHRLGHMSFQGLQKFAKLGLIPHNLAKVNPAPLCSLCAFAAAHKCLRWTKSAPHHIWKPDDACPGDCVSIDQIVSGQSGMVPQSSGYTVND